MNLDLLLEWCQGRSIWVSDSLLIQQDQSGLCVKVKEGRSCRSDELVSVIPKDAIFSTKTSSLSHLLPSCSSSNPPTREGFSRLTSSPGSISGLELAFHLLYEFTLGEVSPFHGYLQSLPQKLDLPLTWSTSQDPQINQAWQWLVGTEVERCLKRAERSSNPFHGMCMSRLEDYFEMTVIPALRSLDSTSGLLTSNRSFRLPNRDQSFTLWTLFLHSYSMVSSRAFVVDLYHEMALVPVADLYNHLDSTSHNIQFEADSLVCTECGALPTRSCSHFSKERRRKHQSGEEDSTGTNLDEMLSVNSMDTLDMRTTSSIEENEECFNSYGSTLSNAQLLLQYGFVLDVGTENERFVWEWDDNEEREELVDSLVASRIESFKGTDLKKLKNNWNDLINRFSKPTTSDSQDTTRGSLSYSQTFSILNLSKPLRNRSQGSQFTRTESEEIIGSSLRDFLIPVSKSSNLNDITIDERFPIFIDGEGCFSLVLWRLIVLGSIALLEAKKQSSGSSSSTEDLDELLLKVESRLEEISKRCREKEMEGEDEEIEKRWSTFLKPTEDRHGEKRNDLAEKILLSSLESLLRLVENRIEKLKLFQDEDMALDLLDKSDSNKSSALHYALNYAYSEFSSLKISLDKVKELISILDT